MTYINLVKFVRKRLRDIFRVECHLKYNLRETPVRKRLHLHSCAFTLKN